MLSLLHSVENMAFPYNSGLKTQAWELGKGKEWWLIPLLSHSCILSSWVFSSSVCRCSGALLPDTCWPPFPLLWLLFKCQVLLWDTLKKKFFIYFNCRIITLQYCDGFCLYQQELALGIHVSPLILNPSPTSLPTPSLQVVTGQQPGVPCFMYQTHTSHPVYIW